MGNLVISTSKIEILASFTPKFKKLVIFMSIIQKLVNSKSEIFKFEFFTWKNEKSSEFYALKLKASWFLSKNFINFTRKIENLLIFISIIVNLVIFYFENLFTFMTNNWNIKFSVPNSVIFLSNNSNLVTFMSNNCKLVTIASFFLN